MGVRVTSNVIAWSSRKEREIDLSVLQLATDIDRTSAALAPVLTRQLVNSKRIERKGNAHYSISYNTPYARRRHFENKKNPGTLLYLKRAGDVASKNIRKYLPKD